MLPVDITQGAGVAGGSSHGGSRFAPVFRPASAAGRPFAQPLALGGRSAPVAVAGGRARASARSSPACGAASAALAVAAPLAASGSDCLSREVLEFGYDKHIEDKYQWGRELGKGGNGVVRLVCDRITGEELACKAISKTPAADASDAKRRGHADSIRREVEVMRRLAGSLAVVRLVDVYEDEENVYLIQEMCRGGELHHRINDRHYSERTVASFMRAVLRTLAQCHSHRILHRDIKPGNFMLLDDSERSPLKAIDFGLAVPYDPENLPRTDLGLEGTPWFMAPEVLSSQVVPASDVWSAGVMAHQLLTGRLPFDDHRNPAAPSISAIWRSVLCDRVNYDAPWWSGISEDAKDFVQSLLERDPSKRPTAKEALNHRWLRGDSSERSAGRQIDLSVVARIQRFAQASLFKRGVFQMIAEELLSQPGAAAALASSAAAQGQDLEGSSGRGSARRRAGGARGAGVVTGAPDCGALQNLFTRLDFDPSTPAVDASHAAAALAKMGFQLKPAEAVRLAQMLDTSNSGRVKRAALAASQIDFKHLQQANMDAWVGIARSVFSRLDRDQDGVISPDEIVSSLRAKLPDDELRAVLEHVRAEAGGAMEGGLDFNSFLDMLKVGSIDNLEQYDARLNMPSPASLGRLQALLDASQHGSDAGGSTHHRRGGSSHGRGTLFRAAAAIAAAAPVAPVNGGFRFDVPREAPSKPQPAAPGNEPRQDAGQAQGRPHAPWPGLTLSSPAPPVRPLGAVPPAPGAPLVGAGGFAGVPAARGGVRGVGEVRVRGGSLYKNMAAQAPAAGGLMGGHQ